MNTIITAIFILFIARMLIDIRKKKFGDRALGYFVAWILFGFFTLLVPVRKTGEELVDSKEYKIVELQNQRYFVIIHEEKPFFRKIEKSEILCRIREYNYYEMETMTYYEKQD